MTSDIANHNYIVNNLPNSCASKKIAKTFFIPQIWWNNTESTWFLNISLSTISLSKTLKCLWKVTNKQVQNIILNLAYYFENNILNFRALNATKLRIKLYQIWVNGSLLQYFYLLSTIQKLQDIITIPFVKAQWSHCHSNLHTSFRTPTGIIHRTARVTWTF